MKSSDISSAAKSPCPPSATPPRSSFALSGPTVPVDPATNAIRADLADIRLADRVFAPHYARPMTMTAIRAAAVRTSPAADAETVSTLAPGDAFDVLEVATGFCWGQNQADGRVGYVEKNALDLASRGASDDRARP